MVRVDEPMVLVRFARSDSCSLLLTGRGMRRLTRAQTNR